ncbi:MAG: hypothetical protein KA223_05655, partial [Candidatus Accumulibacter sp.]|nr:hypothetical protein [Accumulibacter sp.]
AAPSPDPGQAADEGLAESRSFVLTVRSPSEAPRLSAPQQVVALAGQTLSLALQASDLDQDPLRWSVEGLPPGAELSAGAAYGQATLSWTPTADDLGRHDLELVVTDSGLPPRDAGYALPEQPEPNVTRHRLRVVVRADNRAPEVLGFTVDGQTVADHGGTLAIDAREGVPLALEVFGRDADADPITWQFDGLPRGLLATPDGNRLALAWTPDFFAAQEGNTGAPGIWRFTLTGSDGAARTTRSVELSVADVNQTPRLLPLPQQAVNEGETLAFTVRATDADHDAVQLSWLHDETTPPGVQFNAATGYFEWTPDHDTVDPARHPDAANGGDDSRTYRFTFRASDGRAVTAQTVEVRVFDVNRSPRVRVGNHAVVVGNTASIPVVFGDAATTGIALDDPDGAAQTQALTLTFVGLPPGAAYDPQSQRLSWTPGPGQIGDYRVTAQVADGRRGSSAHGEQSFVLRAVANAEANAPTLYVSTTPDLPATPGQTVIVSVRAEAWSGLARLVVEQRAAEDAPWQIVELDAAGRFRLTPQRPGLIDLRVTATDHDGFSSSHSHRLRVRDPADTQAPQLAWTGTLAGTFANSAPTTVRRPLAVGAELRETQAMGWRLQMAPAGSEAWTTLASQEDRATAVDQALALTELDPAAWANGVWRLRLTAWDLSGRRGEIETRVVIDSRAKAAPAALVADPPYRLAGHTLAVTRLLPFRPAAVAGAEGAANPVDGDFGNWRLPLLDTQFSSDQPATDASGATAAWLDGARVWLTLPASLAGAPGNPLSLSFTLAATSERLADDPAAPLIWRPTFTGSDGWQLVAQAGSGSPAAEPLLRQGQRLYDQITGLPWVPQAYVFVSPDGDRYRLDAQGRIEHIDFADGAQWLVSDAGVAAVTADGLPAERLDFVRDSAGRITRITGVAADDPVTASTLYLYDAHGRLAQVRELAAAAGTPYAYDPQGRLLSDPLSADLGPPVRWPDSVWNGSLAGGAVLGFTLRESEIRSAAARAGDPGALIVAVDSRADDADATIEYVGGEVLGSTLREGTRTTLLRVSDSGLQLLRLSGSGQASVRLRIAGDLNHDSHVDAADALLWEAAQQAAASAADINGDGHSDPLDRQIVFANTGFAANQAPATIALPSLTTHTDLSLASSLADLADDREGDAVFWQILGATHGAARLSGDGQTLIFTPQAGFSGPASVTLQADDGYSAAAPIELTVNVSSARLTAIRLDPLAPLFAGQTAQLSARLDFADQAGVALADAAYLTVHAADLADLGYTGASPVVVDDAVDQIRATGVGPALIVVERRDGNDPPVQAVAAINPLHAASIVASDATASTDQASPAPSVEPDVYPGTLTLVPGSTRQLRVHLVDPASGERIDIHGASQIA